MKFGTRLRDNRDSNSTNANFNGTFSFASIADYQALMADLAANMTFAQIAAGCTQQQCALPNKLTYTTGPLPATVNVFDAAVFLQDDWKVNRNLTVSGGLRWESQNHVSDHSDWAPRVSFAYALDGHKDAKQAKTVLRGGYGIFYDRLTYSTLLGATRQSGGPNSQKQIVISNPQCFDANSLSNIPRLIRLRHDIFKCKHNRADRTQLSFALCAADWSEPGAAVDEVDHADGDLSALIRGTPVGDAGLECIPAGNLYVWERHANRGEARSIAGHCESVRSRSGIQAEPGDRERKCTHHAHLQHCRLL